MGKSMVSGSDFPQQTNPLRGPMEQGHKDPCPEGLRSSLEFTRVHFTQGSLYLMIMSKPTLVRNPTKPGSEPSQFWSAAPPFTNHFHVNVDFFSGVKPKLKIRIWWIYIYYIIYIIYYVIWIYLLPLYPHMVGFCWCFKSLYIVIS